MHSLPTLIAPYGDQLIDLMVPDEDRIALREYATHLPSLYLSARSICDLEVLAVGGFSPLNHFMGQDDYERVLGEMRLGSGCIFSIPVTLPVERLPAVKLDGEVALRDPRNEIIAVMTVEEVYSWDLADAAKHVCGTQDLRHPLVAEMHRWGKLNISGRLQVINLPKHYDFHELRLTPKQTREKLSAFMRRNVVAFQTRNPLHRAHEELTKRAVWELDGVLLLHPVVGMTKTGDVDHYTRVRTYKALTQRYYESNRILLALLPLAMRFCGPREALWHALIRRNYGANHLIVGRDHASPGVGSTGEPFYGAYEAQELVAEYQQELGVGMIPFRELVYVPEEERYEECALVKTGLRTASLSGKAVREDYLERGRTLPEWFTRPEVADILSDTYPPRHRQGLCIWFTGLSGAGKTTTAEVLTTLILAQGRQVSVLDGDVVRTHLSQGLGFSKEDRDANIRRIAFVSAEVVRHGGVVITATVSPYRATRNEARSMIGQSNFIEVFVDTPLEICEQRDVKGMYAKARRGEIRNFTGIDDPYEPPVQPEIRIETFANTAEENAHLILNYLLELGFVQP
jgi:sulfate adenylyltransferase